MLCLFHFAMSIRCQLVFQMLTSQTTVGLIQFRKIINWNTSKLRTQHPWSISFPNYVISFHFFHAYVKSHCFSTIFCVICWKNHLKSVNICQKCQQSKLIIMKIMTVKMFLSNIVTLSLRINLKSNKASKTIATIMLCYVERPLEFVDLQNFGYAVRATHVLLWNINKITPNDRFHSNTNRFSIAFNRTYISCCSTVFIAFNSKHRMIRMNLLNCC